MRITKKREASKKAKRIINNFQFYEVDEVVGHRPITFGIDDWLAGKFPKEYRIKWKYYEQRTYEHAHRVEKTLPIRVANYWKSLFPEHEFFNLSNFNRVQDTNGGS